MHLRKIMTYSLFLSTALSFNAFEIGSMKIMSGSAMAAGMVPEDPENDARSVISESSLGGAYGGPCGRGRTPWERDPDLTPSQFTFFRRHRDFAYIVPSTDEPLKNINFVYNTYPFDLPSCDVETGTISLTPESPFVTATDDLLPELHDSMRFHFNQIMITDFPDITRLSALGGPRMSPNRQAANPDDVGERRAYGLHFFGKLSDAVESNEYVQLSKIRSVIDAWGGRDSLAKCMHLDFAIASPGGEDLVNMTDDEQRHRVLTSIINIINSPGASELETLSLRFMHLKSQDLNYLGDAILNSPRNSFKRLILSYNDIDDSVMTDAGIIGRLIANVNQLPVFQVLDLRGNNFTEIETWNLDNSVQNRRISRNFKPTRIIPLLRLSNHGFTDAELNIAQVRAKLGVLEGFTDLGQSEGFGRQDIADLKMSYDGGTLAQLPQSILQRWTLRNPSYRAIADELLILRNGQSRAFTSLDLSDRSLSLENVAHFLSHASGRQPLITLNLKNTYVLPEEVQLIDDNPLEVHRKIVDYAGSFKTLQNVLISNNRLNNDFSEEYADLIGQLPNLRGISLASVGFGSGGADRTNLLVSNHFGSITVAAGPHRFLRMLNYSGNIINDRDLGMILPRLQNSRTLGYISLAGNQITLAGGISAAGYGTHLVNFLIGVNEHRDGSANSFKGIDITDNSIEPSDMEAVIGEYKRKQIEADANPHRSWPVLIINARTVEAAGSRQTHYISSPEGLLELARAYDYAALDATEGQRADIARTWINAFDENTETKATILYKEASVEKSRFLINRVSASMERLWPAALNVAEFPEGTQDNINEATAILMTHYVETTPENVAKRAKLLKYVNDHKNEFTTVMGLPQVEARKSLFRSLTKREQEKRIYDAFMSLPEAEPISDENVLRLGIDNLI